MMPEAVQQPIPSWMNKTVCQLTRLHLAYLQDELQKAHLALEVRLQQALQLHLLPKTTLDSDSPADKCLQLLDALLEVHLLLFCIRLSCHHAWAAVCMQVQVCI